MTTLPPKKRDGHQFPGGRKMRKALARLAARKLSAETTSSGKNVRHEYRMPGSMKP